MAIEARSARKADIPTLARVLGRAFYDDPVITWMLPNEKIQPARLRRLFASLTRHHPAEPHWYLAVIGSDTAVRGRGFGQAMMRSRLDRCDTEHCPAYLESSKPENVPYYEPLRLHRHG